MSAEASSVLADLLETEGAPAALSWRIRAAQNSPARAQYRLAWSKTAIAMGAFDSAQEALDGLSPAEKKAAEYHKLAGALAWGLKKREEAEQQYLQVLQLEPANQTAALNLAIIHLSSTNTAVAEAGRLRLQQMTTNADVGIQALRMLETEALSRKSFVAALEYARRLAEVPNALVADRIDYLQALRHENSADFAPDFALLQREALTNSAQALALGRWMAVSDNATNALHWLRTLPSGVQTNQAVPLLIADCLVAINDWTSLLNWVGEQDWGEANFYRLALESLARSSLKQEAAAKSAWRKAARLADRRLDRLVRLSQLCTAWGWKSQRAEALRDITSEFPKEKWAAGLLESQYYEEGDTQALADLLTRSYAADPSDPKLKNDLANISLLRKYDLDKAYRMAKEAYDSAPGNPFFASTYAYALLLQEKPAEALKVISGVNTNFLKIPSVAGYYGIVQARSGHNDLAREPLKVAGTGALLPEEREIVRLAQSQP